MIDKTRWLGLGPWHEDNESELIDWTAQPQYKGLVKGDYYHAELRYSGRWGDPGHKGELDVVFDDDGKIAFAEFNETTMGNYYVRHFQNVSKRRTEFQFFQDFHDKRRSVAYGRVLVTVSPMCIMSSFLQAFVRNFPISLHIKQLSGKNSHHIAEGIFKALGRTLRKAVEIDRVFADEIPSTKGVL